MHDYKAAKRIARRRIVQGLQDQVNSVKEDIANVEMRKRQEEIVKTDPFLVDNAQDMLLTLKMAERRCNEEAAAARKMAEERYGSL